MTQNVTLPLWLLVLILLFAAVTASTHLLFPSVRWFFRRRAERIVAELNKRLERPIQPFKLLRRQDMIQRVIYDPEVVRAAGAYAAANGVREDVAFERARDYAREIVPSFSASAYFGFAIRFARWLSTSFFDVRLHRDDAQALGAIDPEATVVFVINHRSNFDYVLVTYLAAEQSALSYAVGEWARVWPMSRLIRAMGAYFIRRRSRDGLYRKVLSTYVQKATEAGVTQAVFPEGGLSRTGHVGDPKLGILSYVVQGAEASGRDVAFVPVALNYDRVVEDRILVAAGRSEKRRFRASAPEAVRFTARYLWRRIRGRVGRFGVAAVTFGRPVLLSAADVATETVAEFADRLADDIRRDVPLTTTPLLCVSLFALGGGGTVEEVSREMAAVKAEVPETVADFSRDSHDLESLGEALELMCLRHILRREDGRFVVHDPDLAAFYANSISQHLSSDRRLAIPEISPVQKSEET